MLQSFGKHIIVLEDVVHNGCLGQSIAEAVHDSGKFDMSVQLLNTGNRFLPHGSVAELREYCGLDGASVAKSIRTWADALQKAE